MSKQQLLIEGMAVDMPTEEIKLKVESNLFNDASKIKTAHSYNIALPRTMANDSIFALAYIPSAETGGKTTHKYLKASLYMDGVPLFENGRAVVTKVDEKGYNLTLLWGLLPIFDEIKNEGLNLCDLPMSSRWDESRARWLYLPSWNEYGTMTPLYESGMNQSVYNNLDEESHLLATWSPWLLPSIAAWRVLSDAMNLYGINLQMTAEASSRLNKLWHPLTTRKAQAKDEQTIINGLIKMRAMDVAESQWLPSFIKPTIDTDHRPNIVWDALPTPLHPVTTNHSAENSNIANAAVSFVMGTTTAYTSLMQAECNLQVKRVRLWGTIPYQAEVYIPNLNNMRLSGQYSAGYFSYNYDITRAFNVNSGDPIIKVVDEWGQPLSSYQQGSLNCQVTIEGAEGVQNLRPWDYVRNYPQMTIINYLNEILAHIGGVIVGSTTMANVLRIATLDELAAKKPVTYDVQGVKVVTMSFNDLAQKNVYKHKENTDLDRSYTASGTIYTSDETLALERTAFESKFKVPINGRIPLWEVEDNKAKWKNVGDFIATNEDGYIFNGGQDFASIISDYYTNYEKLAERPKVVEAIIRLSVLDLININLGQPVYIKQLGRTYLVDSLETENGDNYKVKLVQV